MLMLTSRAFPQDPPVKRNVEYLVDRGLLVDLIHMAPTGALDWQPPRLQGLRRFQLPIRHRRGSAAGYVLEYGVTFALALLLATGLATRHRYAAVHVDNPPDTLVFAPFLAKLRGAQLLFNIADPMPNLVASRLGVGPRHPAVVLARALERLATAWADRVTVPNERLDRQMLIKRGTKPDKIHFLPNILPVVCREPQRRPAAPVLVYLGTLMPGYGVQVGIDAMALLRDRWPELTLRILGDGEYEPELRRQVSALGLDGRVHFLGFLPWPQAMVEVRRATLGIVPLLPDGYGDLMTPTKLLEYVQQGLPAVCARLPGIEAFFPDGTVGYFEAGSASALAGAISELLADPDGAVAMARRAQQALARFSWEEFGPRYLEILLGAPQHVPSRLSDASSP